MIILCWPWLFTWLTHINNQSTIFKQKKRPSEQMATQWGLVNHQAVWITVRDYVALFRRWCQHSWRMVCWSSLLDQSEFPPHWIFPTPKEQLAFSQELPRSYGGPPNHRVSEMPNVGRCWCIPLLLAGHGFLSTMNHHQSALICGQCLYGYSPVDHYFFAESPGYCW